MSFGDIITWTTNGDNDAIFDVAACRARLEVVGSTGLHQPSTMMLSLMRAPKARDGVTRLAARAFAGVWAPGGCGHDVRVRCASTRRASSSKPKAGRAQPALAGLPSREECMKQLKAGEEFDLLVIGGGSTGAGAALDAATRGLKVRASACLHTALRIPNLAAMRGHMAPLDVRYCC